MMDISGLALVAMVAMMILMCGGMITGTGWGIVRGRRRHAGPAGQRARTRCSLPSASNAQLSDTPDGGPGKETSAATGTSATEGCR
jgi:hypothetical protein